MGGTFLWLGILYLLGLSICGAEPLDEFIEDIIETWHLQLPTIVVEEYTLEVCMTQKRVLCTKNHMDIDELAEHLAFIHLHRKQDGVIFVGNKGHKKLLDLLSLLAPTMFTSDCPIFMPLEYAEDVKLRLDSNVVFFKETSSTNYELFDVFAVKGGPLISLDLGTWSKPYGIIIQNNMNRWDRRRDLKGATFINSLLNNGFYSQILRDHANNIIGSWGFFQEMLFYITEKVNMTVQTTEVPHEPWEMLENGSWTGGIGILQRNEVDIVSLGLGQTSQRCSVIDCPMSTLRNPLTLIAAKPKGTTVRLWVYIEVFGVIQWAFFFAFLAAFVMMTILFNTNGGEESQQSESKINISLKAIESAYLFMIQLGNHDNVWSLGKRLLALTASMLTLLMFVYYTNDITAKMTSGGPKIPIRTFDDVIHHEYKVIVASSYYKSILETAKHGTAKLQVYKKDIKNEPIRDYNEALKEIISDPKTLWFTDKLTTVPVTAIWEELFNQVVALKMDDSGYTITGFGLQKESEFLKMFNHYLLKENENGIRNRLYKKYFISLYVKEEFGMNEPQPLGVDNVIFTFACLGVGGTTAMGIAIVEFVVRKMFH